MKGKASKKTRMLSIEDLQRSIQNDALKSCYLFAGSEQFTADEGVAILRDSLIPEDQRSFNYDVVYGHDVQAQDIVALVSSYPMMGEYRMVVVKDFDKCTKPDAITSYVKHPLESTILVLISESPDMRKNPYRLFDESNTLNCKPVYDNQIPQWVMKRVKRYKKNITSDAAAMLAAYTGTSLRQVANELDKLDIYTADRNEITIEDVNTVVGVTKAYNIFELYKAIGQKNASSAMNILDRMLERGESPTMIVSMLTRLFTQVTMLTDLLAKNIPRQKIANELKIHHFFMDEYLSYLAHHPSEKIPDRFASLLEADSSLKMTGKDPHHVLSLLLYRLLDIDSVTIQEYDELESQVSE